MVENCHGCSSECSSCQVCPVCGVKGMDVPYETVKSLTKEELKVNEDHEFYLCVNRACHVAYYASEYSLSVKEINVPIWFKKQKEKYMICYCRDITLDDVLDTVKEMTMEQISKQDILEKLNKLNIKTDCLHQNPTGTCCDPLFKNAISYALKHR